MGNKIFTKKAGLSYLEILILIISIFSFAYLISSVFEEVEAQVLNDYSCCEKTKSGSYCQYNQTNDCDSSFRSVPNTCDKTVFCKQGCCFSGNTGLCDQSTPERSCKEEGGNWFEDSFCNIPQCQRGCCEIGNNVLWTTERNCEVEAKFRGMQGEFNPEIRAEVDCIFLTEKNQEGACVFEREYEKSCRYITAEACRSTEGDFYIGGFCSDPALETGCEAKDHKACVEGDESVYWFDSCGNKEDIAEGCSIFQDTICGEERGEIKCKSINCKVEIDGRIVDKKNGESWCKYEGTIGDGRDVVGSRHIRHICFLGEERIEACSDYRNEICVQAETRLYKGIFTEAACRVNNWRSCIDYNNQEDMKERCEENPDCTIRSVDIDKFKFSVCAPNYPPGFDITNEAGQRNAELTCSLATQTCTVIYVKDWDGDWNCEINCGCEKEGFAQQMNEFCTSLGDCGAYANIEGEVTDKGYTTSGSPRLSQRSLDELKKYAQPKSGQVAKPGDLSFLGKIGEIEVPEFKGPSGTLGMVSMGVGIVSLIAPIRNALAGMPVIGSRISNFGARISGETIVAKGAEGGITSGQAFGNALSAVGAALSVANILQIGFNMDTTSALILGAAITVGVYVLGQSGLLQGIGIGSGWAAVNVLGWIGLGISIYMWIIGVGDTKEKQVTFTCLPWLPPRGGNCDACNPESSLDVPCSKYRCQSLGQTCELINQGTEQEFCMNNDPNDISSPRISPRLGNITEGYNYYNINERGFEILTTNEDCIPEFTPVTFGIETNKPAQCKIGTSATQSYEEMQYFGGSNFYLFNHTSTLTLPSPEYLKYQYNLTESQIRELGEIKMYVKCENLNGVVNTAAYTIKTCVKPGPDHTPPYIRKIEPERGSYLKYDATEKDIKFWVNEPSECKYDVEDVSFSEMTNEILCKTDYLSQELYGWPCNTTLDVSETTKFYIRCRDISDNKNEMNAEVYELTRSESELSIDEIIPNGEVIAGVEPTTISLEAYTSGGAEDGKSRCEWKELNRGWSDFFIETNSAYHKYPELSLFEGNYIFEISCEDVAGNKAVNITEFSVKIDRKGPAITRVYNDGVLFIMTNENSTCAYSFTDSKCGFDIENSTLMSGEGKEHTAEWQTEFIYYIKCKDHYGNKPGKCSIIIRPYEVT